LKYVASRPGLCSPIPADGQLTAIAKIHRPYREARNLTVRFEKQLNAMFGATALSAGEGEHERGKAAGRGWHEAER